MAYKKFIIKNGKKYGPYTYHSKRVDGKVVSEYHGKKPDINISAVHSGINIKPNKKFYIGLGIVIISLLLFSLPSLQKVVSGNAVLNLETTYKENETLQGAMTLSLKEGELIPANSKVKIETQSQTYEYLLKDLIDDETTTGNFYVEGESISGSGEGYGIEGNKKSFEEVSFVLEISSSSDKEKETKTTNEETIGESPSTSETTSPETTPQENTPTEETSQENTGETNTNEESSTETPSENGAQNNGQSENANENSQPQNSENSNPESSAETESSPVTGSIITRFFLGIIRGITPTGQASLKIENEIDGTVSESSPYTYTLEEGQSASIKQGSVRVKSTDKKISDGEVSISQEGNKVTITTDYTEESENGFGEEYVSEQTGKEITINLDDLNIDAEKGALKVSLVYENEELVSVNTELDIEGETLATSFTNQTIAATSLELSLTPQEKEILLEEFGNSTIKTTKAEIFNDRLLVRYELGKYWIEYTYDYSDENLNNKQLQGSMETDREKWLKDISKEISKTKEENEKVDSLLGGSFNITEIEISNVTIKSINRLEESQNETNSEEQTPEGTSSEVNNETIVENNETETTSNETSSEENTEEVVQETTETPTEKNTSETSITGGAITNTNENESSFISKISNFFKNLFN